MDNLSRQYACVLGTENLVLWYVLSQQRGCISLLHIGSLYGKLNEEGARVKMERGKGRESRSLLNSVSKMAPDFQGQLPPPVPPARDSSIVVLCRFTSEV